MTRRLLASYLTLTVFVLAMLEVPLAVSYAHNERQDLTAKVERDATTIATIAQGAVDEESPASTATLAGVVDRYSASTGARVLIVDASGAPIADSTPADERAGGDYGSRPEFQRALGGQVATGARSSHTLGHDLLYVAVPISADGKVHGAVRITFSTSTVDRRVHRYWLTLAGVAVVVLAVASLVGLRFARSIARPLDAVEQAAALVGTGDLAARAPTDAGPPEVRSLAASFNATVAKLDELLEAQEAFVADASHQLRSPLAALRLRLENLERDVAAAAASDLDGALAEVARLSRLVDGLLELARADRGGATPVALDAGVVVVERLDAWSALADERDVSLHAEVGTPSPVAWATPGRLEQVLDNLLANALEASAAGGAIVVRAAVVDGAPEIRVVDDGPGLTEEERRRAFDRFWRRSGEGGSGLGLSIVRRLVESDGGSVALEAAPRGGIDAVVRLRPAPGGRIAEARPGRRPALPTR